MAITPCCRLMAALVAAFIFSSSASLWAQGFPRDYRDALGPRYEAAARQHQFPGYRQRRAIDFVRQRYALLSRRGSASIGPTMARPAFVLHLASITKSQPRSPLARLLALVNTTMADAGIAIWESKYNYNFWRPVTAIREANAGTGPTGQADGNPATIGDPDFSPLGAPASNLNGPNFTPPFPPAMPVLAVPFFRFYGNFSVRTTFDSRSFRMSTMV